jgi:hypothetical protein
MRSRAFDGDRWQFFTLRRIAAERAEREVVVERDRAEFQPRARLDVAGEQRECQPLVSADSIEQRDDARERAHASRRIAREARQVVIPESGKARLDVRVGPIRIAENHRCDLRIGAAGEVVAADVASKTVNLGEPFGERLARRAIVRDERSVNVEKHEAV